MEKIIVEVFATTSCNGTSGAVPGVITDLSNELGVDVEFVPYLIWDMDSTANFPEYMAARLAGIKNGELTTGGFFIDGEWYEQRHHNANDVIRIRQKFIDAATLNPDEKNITLLGRSMDAIKMESASVENINFSNSVVSKEMGAFSTYFEAIWFFEGSIKKLSIDNCPIENFIYKGYDVNKLIEIAEKHPELFENKETGDNAKQEQYKVSIDEIQVSLLTMNDLNEGVHPCFLAGSMKSDSKKYKAITEKFGGWGYKAVYNTPDDWFYCGWLGIATKDILRKDFGYMIPCEIPDEYVLYLTCYMGGGSYAPQYHRIGIAKKMINQAISDAKLKGYRRVEAYPHPEIIPVLEKCGFALEELKKNDGETQKYYYFDIM